MQLGADVAELLNRKIKEFEKSTQEETEKNQKAQKGKVRATAKAKLKEAKHLVNSSDTPSADKIKTLWERLRNEDGLAKTLCGEGDSKRKDTLQNENERNQIKAELNRSMTMKGKLEGLEKQLQGQTKALTEERRRVTEQERTRRQELADEFQGTIAGVKKTMDEQAAERSALAKENEDLRSRFKQFFEQYDKREKELVEQQKDHEAEVKSFASKLAEHGQLYRQEAQREAVAQRENAELNSQEEVLRGQLSTYSSKFNHFQEALNKSDKVLGQYKRQRNKMQRRVELLEKENKELMQKNERKLVSSAKEQETMKKQKDSLQEKCRGLQSERQHLLEELAKHTKDSG